MSKHRRPSPPTPPSEPAPRPTGRAHPWLLPLGMAALFVAAIVMCFWQVLSPSVVFLAPDAPLHIFHKSVHLHVEPLHIDQ